PLAHEAVADGVREQPPLWIGPHVAVVGLLERAREHGFVARADDAAADLLLFDELAVVARVVAQRVGLEDRPARRVAHEPGEEHDEEDEDAGDGSVNRGSTASRRARSETSSSSARSTKLARIDEPP